MKYYRKRLLWIDWVMTFEVAVVSQHHTWPWAGRIRWRCTTRKVGSYPQLFSKNSIFIPRTCSFVNDNIGKFHKPYNCTLLLKALNSADKNRYSHRNGDSHLVRKNKRLSSSVLFTKKGRKWRDGINLIGYERSWKRKGRENSKVVFKHVWGEI